MGYKILLADDSVTVQKIITLTFSDEGVDVLTVNNGDEAINRLQYMRPALVMADVSIPGRNGYEICEFIKSHPELQATPVILLVPAFEPFDEEKARSVGADHFLTKPFQSIRTLISTVKSLIEPGSKTVAASIKDQKDGQSFAESKPGNPLDLAKIEADSSRIETSESYFTNSPIEDSDHVLDLDDVLSDVWSPPATRTMVTHTLETGRVIASTAEKPETGGGSSLTLPQTVIDEIVDRVALQVTERLPEMLSRELARRIAPEVIEIIRQQQMAERGAYQESDSLLELDEV